MNIKIEPTPDLSFTPPEFHFEQTLQWGKKAAQDLGGASTYEAFGRLISETLKA